MITTLNRIIWEEYWRPQVFGNPATIMVDAFASLEKDIWSQAATVMTPPQRDELMDLIHSWRITPPPPGGRGLYPVLRFW
ncbi:MAG: hypothetical protein HUK40_08500 [Desulfobacter sp.]|nr:hypothetical protein [Desulfobacter sp.]